MILAAVFIPVAFLGGISGQLYRQFAFTIAASVLIRLSARYRSARRSAPCSWGLARNPVALSLRVFDYFNRAFELDHQ